MNPNYLDFEQPIAELQEKIEELRGVAPDDQVDLSDELERLEDKSRKLTEKIYADLTPWQIVKVGFGLTVSQVCVATEPSINEFGVKS